MKKTKVCLCALTAVASVGVISAVALNNSKISTGSNGGPYSFTLNMDNMFTAAEVGTWGEPIATVKTVVRNTPEGTPITWKAEKGLGITSNGACACQMPGSHNGWITNTTPLNGLSQIKLTIQQTAASFRYDLGYSQSLESYAYDAEQPSYVSFRSETLTGQTEYTFDLSGGNYTYFRLQNLGSTSLSINSLVLTFSCEHTHVYNHFDKVDAFRDETGLEEHYECPGCHTLFDKDKNPTTLDDLKIESRLFSYKSDDPKELKYLNLGETYSLDQNIALFDIKFDKTKYSEFGFKLYPDSTQGENYFGPYWIDSAKSKVLTNEPHFEGDYGGLSLVKMTDDYYRIYADFSKLDTVTGTKPSQIQYLNFIHPSNTDNRGNGSIEVLPTRGDVIYLDSDVTKGSTRTQGIDFTYKNVNVEKKLNIEITYGLIPGDTPTQSTKARLMLHGTSDWENHYGYWGIKNDATFYESSDVGVTLSLLETNKVKAVVDFSNVTRKAGTPDSILTGLNFDWGDIYGHIKVYGETYNYKAS